MADDTTKKGGVYGRDTVMPAKGGGGDGNATLLPGGGKLSELKGRVPSIPGMSTDEVNELFETFKMFDKVRETLIYAPRV